MIKRILFLVGLLSLIPYMPAQGAVIFTNGSTWNYFIGTEEASTPRSAWRQADFADSAWPQGATPIGFATPANDPGGYEATIRTTLPTGSVSNYLSVYLRKPFVIANPADIGQLKFNIVVDDGYIVWVNGTEIGRYNAPAGDPAFNSPPPLSIESTPTVLTTNSPSSFLVAGTNVVAIQLFNAVMNSSDLLIDVGLTYIEPDLVPPTIVNVAPAAGPIGILNKISVTFSEPVTGVNASDLLINGQPAASMTSTNNVYMFSFLQPAFGLIQISWSPNHGIRDASVSANPFDATGPGAIWQYDLEDRIAPTVTALVPQPGFTVRSLSQIEVHFSEPVTGVDPADFRINGNAADAVSILDPSRYLFTFPQPTTGSVQVTWSPNHGITDLASPPNAFVSGLGWTYFLNPNAPPADVIITEFLAANPSWQGAGSPPSNKISDEDGDYSDWIEIFNSGNEDANLNGWHLTDDATKLTKWTFPSTNLVAKGYMIVFASGKDRAIPGRPLHTNFKLSSGGEFLALVKPDGTSIATEFAPTFPPQIDNVSYGFPTLSTPTTLISNSSPSTAHVPMDGNLVLDWTFQNFNDSAWIQGTNGWGFETATNPPPSIRSFIQSDLQTQMFSQNGSAFIRIPFVVNDLTTLDQLTLRLRYDDGFVAYLNGVEVARGNAPVDVPIGEALPWNAQATASRLNTLSTNAEEFDLTSVVRNGGLQTGTNLLAIQGLNSASDDGDFLVSAELVSSHRGIQQTQPRYFTNPTPGADNGAGTESLGPIISDVTSTPKIPGDNDDILVTARITPTFSPVGQVTLTYRVMYGTQVVLPMLDDGQHGDGAANDGIFGATIPASSLTVPGQMIRWYVRATDTQARTLRLPSFDDPNNSPEYFGAVVVLPQTNNLPILHWFLQNPSGATTTTGTRGSVSYLGEFYDNIFANIHGQSSQGFPQKSYNLDFNSGNPLRLGPLSPPDRNASSAGADDVTRPKIDLLTTYADKTHMRNMLSYGTYRDAGSPYHFVIPVRVQTNGGFAGDWAFVEKGDEDFLKRLGKDPNGALYKMYNTFTDPASDVLISSTEAEKKTRQWDGNADLVDLMNGVRLSGAARVNYIYDNLNIPEMINFLAGHILTGDIDCCHKNYYFYRDSDGTGEWEGYPWDVDLSFGRVWNSTDNYWDQRLHPDTSLDIGNNNGVFSVLLTGTPETRQMYLRRIRTLMDQLLGPPTAPVNNYETQIDSWLQLVGPDADLDDAYWPFASTWGNGAGAGSPTSICCTQSMADAASELKTSYLPQRRAYLYTTIGAQFPAAQPTNTIVQIRSVEYSPTNGNQAQEYIELFNTNAYAVDISGWRISGAVDFTFQGGVVIPAATSLYVSPDVKSWRARTVGPRGGQGLFVQGNYQGQLSARGETILLADQTGRAVTSLAYPGTPSPAQQYLRITELMYHPAPLAGNTNSPEEFEYLELKNTGPVAIDLTGVRLTNGVSFNFTGSAVTTLAPGQSVLVVKNLIACTARYGSGFLIAGQYTGNLDNSGERLRLLDAVGEEILDFSYNNSWYPITDGVGFSLVIVDEHAEPDTWGHKENWRASGTYLGSPDQNDPAPPHFAPVLINEALTRTLVVPDSIELYNPNTNSVDISGWYLTDDFGTPQKFSIPSGTIIPAGGYVVFDESQFNPHPGVSPSFALSSDGDELYLFGADTNGTLSGYVHGFSFGAAEEEISFGRYITSEGKEQFVAQSAVTLNTTNAGPKIGPVVISEIMYHPPDVGFDDNTDDEFIELLNITTNAVPLFDPLRHTNTWHLSGGIDFTFPTNVWLPAGQALLVLNIHPSDAALLATFRGKFGVDADVPVFGPYSGKLNNDSDKINLRKPTPPLTNHVPVVVPYAVVDSVEYQDRSPWPAAADGFGASLQRWEARAYGNDPINWIAARPLPGAATTTNGTGPQITLQPASHALLIGADADLIANVTGTAPFTFQWRFNGTNLPGATALTLQLTNLQAQQSGDYQLVVINQLGSAFSDTASITVRFPIAIVQQPQTIDVRIPPDLTAAPSTNATFKVVGSSLAPIHFQWSRNGSDIPDATNDTLTIFAVKTNDLAYFAVTLTDDLSSTRSSNVWLYPLISPTFTDTPISQTVVRGGQVTLSAQIAGWPPPFTFEWRVGTVLWGSSVQTEPFSFFTFVATNPNPVSYRAIVSNRALPAGRASGLATITTLLDSDGDGIPDAWEIAHGSLTNNAADRFLDPDGDGMLNWQEYQAGTDPTNALSNLMLHSTLGTNATTLRLDFQGVSNKTYAVQYIPSLSETNWQTLTRIVGRRTNRVEVIFDPLTTNRYYRVVTPSPAP